MENKTLSYIAVGVAIIALIIAFVRSPQSGATNSNPNSTFEKVMASGTLRAGYINYPPYVIKDPKTGQLSGVFYDLTNALAAQLGLKVQWVEEAGYGTIFTDLDSGRYDVFGGGLWANSTRAKAGYLSAPAYYSAVYAYVKANDHRFDNNLNAINDPSVKISTLDGDLGQVIAKADFPKASEVSLPQSAPFDQISLQIISGKADVAFLQLDAAELFLKANPGTLRQVPSQPLRIFGNSYAVKLGENDLYQMLNVALQEAINSGTVAKILSKYDPSSNLYLHLAAPYKQ